MGPTLPFGQRVYMLIVGPHHWYRPHCILAIFIFPLVSVLCCHSRLFRLSLLAYCPHSEHHSDREFSFVTWNLSAIETKGRTLRQESDSGAEFDCMGILIEEPHCVEEQHCVPVYDVAQSWTA